MKSLLLTMIILLGSLSAQTAGPVLSEDFELEKTEGLYARLERNDFLSVVPGEGVDGGAALRARYVGSDVGSERIVVIHDLPQPLLEATLNFDVNFENDFQWVKGGKLHGFGPKDRVTGGNPIRPDGWSTRCMFHSEGTIDNYTYHQDQPGTYGEGGDRVASFNFEKGRYYALSYHVRVNDPPENANGFFHVYINGEMVRRQDDLQLRGVGGDTTLIYSLLFSTFHGGNDDSWAPKNRDGSYATVHALFDNFAVYEGLHNREEAGMEVVSVLPNPSTSSAYLYRDRVPGMRLFSVNGRVLAYKVYVPFSETGGRLRLTKPLP